MPDLGPQHVLEANRLHRRERGHDLRHAHFTHAQTALLRGTQRALAEEVGCRHQAGHAALRIGHQEQPHAPRLHCAEGFILTHAGIHGGRRHLAQVGHHLQRSRVESDATFGRHVGDVALQAVEMGLRKR